jgi:outer membrane immunogenic protein
MGVIMNKLLFATLSIGALMISVAKAADLPRKAPPAPVPVAPTCAQFGGWYVGVQGGFVSNRHEFTNLDNFGVNLADHVSQRRITGHVGPQTGWNWQWNCTVFGLQADWSWSGGRQDNSFRGFPFTTMNNENRTRWFATARARSGVVVDNLLLYVTGGAAFANHRNENVMVMAPFTETFSNSRTRVGFAVGAGAEWSFAGNWSINSEFLYMAFERDRRALNCTTVVTCSPFPVGTPFRFEHQNEAWVGRIGLNYRFGGFGGGPVLARY